MLKAIAASFRYAFAGIGYCISTQRNVRIHICFALTVLLIAPLYALTRAELAVLFVTIALVIGLEMVNTAVEAAVDLVSPQRNPHAKIAKDAAAGAVLVSAMLSVAVAFALFWKIPVLLNILGYLAAHLWMLIPIAAYVCLCVWFICGSLFQKEEKSHE